MIALPNAKQTKWSKFLYGEDPKWVTMKCSRDIIVCSVLYLSVWSLVYGTGIPNDLVMWPTCLWVGHIVTTCVWWRRVLKKYNG